MHHAGTFCLRGLGQQTGGAGIDRVRKLSFGFSAIDRCIGGRIDDNSWSHTLDECSDRSLICHTQIQVRARAHDDLAQGLERGF